MSIIGGTIGGPYPAPLADAAVFDIRNEPITPVGSAKTADDYMTNWRCVQGLIDREGAKGPCIVKIPSGIWKFARPINIPYNGVVIQGSGAGVTTLAPVGSFPTIVSGVRPTYKGKGLLKTDFEDIKPLLDGTIGGFGPKLRGPGNPRQLMLSIPYQAWSHPGVSGKRGDSWDCYDRLTAFTLEVAFNIGDTPWGNLNGVICGVSERSQMTPFQVGYRAGAFRLSIAMNNGKTYTSSCPAPNISGVVRLVVQFNVATGQVDWILNKQWISSSTLANYVGGAALYPNDTNSFKFCGSGENDGAPTDYQVIDKDFGFTLLGARLSDCIRYTPGKLPTTDRLSYRNPDANAIALIPFDDDLDYVISSRIFRVTNWQGSGSLGVGCGWLFDQNGSNTWASVGNVAIRDLAIRGYPDYGFTLALGANLDTRISDVAVTGGAVGIGNLKLVANYITRLSGSITVGASLFGMKWHRHMVAAEGVICISGFGLAALWSEGGNFDFNQIFINVGTNASTKYVIYSQGNFCGRKVGIDNEGDRTSSVKAIVKADLMPNTSLSTLKIDFLNVAACPGQASVVCLDSQYHGNQTATHGYRRGRVEISDLAVDEASNHRAVYEVCDSLWSGDMAVSWLPSNAVPYTVVASADKKCNVHHTFDMFDDIPADREFVPGCHTLIRRQPPPGGWTRAECAVGADGAMTWMTNATQPIVQNPVAS